MKDWPLFHLALRLPSATRELFQDDRWRIHEGKRTKRADRTPEASKGSRNRGELTNNSEDMATRKSHKMSEAQSQRPMTMSPSDADRRNLWRIVGERGMRRLTANVQVQRCKIPKYMILLLPVKSWQAAIRVQTFLRLE